MPFKKPICLVLTDLAGFKDMILRPSHLRSSMSVVVSLALLFSLTGLVSFVDTWLVL